MVSAVNRRNLNLREVLDTTETEMSDTADQIRTYHSVLMVSDSHTGANSGHESAAHLLIGIRRCNGGSV